MSKILLAAEKLRDDPKYGWQSFFKENFHLIEKIQEVVNRSDGTFYPKRSEIFAIYKKIRPENIRVVILGQDPYHSQTESGQPTAMGLAFSVRSGSKIAPSLRNIFKVIKQNTGKESQCSETGDLTPWAEQGIFLLNACLTVKPGEAGSHGDIWTGFIKRTLAYIFRVAVFTPIKDIDSDTESVEEDGEQQEEIDVSLMEKKDLLPIALLWGAKAQAFASLCGGHILMTTHPSPMSARNGFMTCDHFSRTNQLSKARGDKPIQW